MNGRLGTFGKALTLEHFLHLHWGVNLCIELALLRGYGKAEG